MTKLAKYEAGDTFILKGCKTKYNYTIQPDTKYDSDGVWKTTVVLNDEDNKILREEGFNVRVDGDNDNVLTVKRKCRTAAGKEQDPPRVVDGQKNPITEMIGNGSVCNIQVYAKYNNPRNPDQVCAYLNAMQVTTLVPYSGGSGGDFDVVDTVTDDVPF